jgi:hypothetical protein
MGAGDAGTVRVQLPQLPPGAARALKRQRSPGTRRPDSGAVRPVRPRPAARAAAAAACARGLAERRRAGLEPALRAPAAVCRAERGGRRCLHQPVRSARRPAVPGDQGRRGARRGAAEGAAGQALPVASARAHRAAGAGTAWARGEGAGGADAGAAAGASRRDDGGSAAARAPATSSPITPVRPGSCPSRDSRAEVTSANSAAKPHGAGPTGVRRGRSTGPRPARPDGEEHDGTDRRPPDPPAAGRQVKGGRPGPAWLGRAKVGRAGPARNRNEPGRAGPGQVTRASPRTRR